MTPEEDWQARQERNALVAERWEVSTRARLDSRRAALAAKLAREPEEIAALLHNNRVALMGGGSL